MSADKIVIEYDIEELKQLVTGIVAERVMRDLPMATRRDIAKSARAIAVQRLADKIEIELGGA